MPTWKIVAGVIGAAMIATSGSCTDMVTPAAEEGWPGENALSAATDAGRPAPGTWPDNEPGGMTPIFSVNGSSKEWSRFSGGGAWMNADRIRVVKDPASKYGRAIEKRFFVGDDSGWHGVTWRGNYGAFREIYQRIVFRVSSNWQWHSGGSKFFYWGGSGRPSRRSPTQFYINSTGGGEVQFINQSGSGEPDSRGTFRTIGPRITRGRYHTIEVLHTANTPGRSDGALRMWIDGVEVNGFSHLGRRHRRNVTLENLRWLDYSDTRLTGIEAFMFWGGQGDTKRVNDWIRLSELYVSGKNRASTAGGGGEPPSSGDDEPPVGGGDESPDQTLTGSWSFSASGGNSASDITCTVKGTANLFQEGAEFDGSIVGTTECAWPGRSAEWRFDDTAVGSIAGNKVVFEMIQSNGHAKGTASRNSMGGPVTWKINTGTRRGAINLTGNWRAVRR